MVIARFFSMILEYFFKDIFHLKQQYHNEIAKWVQDYYNLEAKNDYLKAKYEFMKNDYELIKEKNSYIEDAYFRCEDAYFRCEENYNMLKEDKRR